MTICLQNNNSRHSRKKLMGDHTLSILKFYLKLSKICILE